MRAFPKQDHPLMYLPLNYHPFETTGNGQVQSTVTSPLNLARYLRCFSAPLIATAPNGLLPLAFNPAIRPAQIRQ
jgi:hypothetical protein